MWLFIYFRKIAKFCNFISLESPCVYLSHDISFITTGLILLTEDMALWVWVDHKSNVLKWNMFSQSSQFQAFHSSTTTLLSVLMNIIVRKLRCSALTLYNVPYLWKLLVNKPANSTISVGKSNFECAIAFRVIFNVFVLAFCMVTNFKHASFFLKRTWTVHQNVRANRN